MNPPNQKFRTPVSNELRIIRVAAWMDDFVNVYSFGLLPERVKGGRKYLGLACYFLKEKKNFSLIINCFKDDKSKVDSLEK